MSFLQKQTLLRRAICIASNSLLSVSLSGKSTLSRDLGSFRANNKKRDSEEEREGCGEVFTTQFCLGPNMVTTGETHRILQVKGFLDIFLCMSFY